MDQILSSRKFKCKFKKIWRNVDKLYFTISMFCPQCFICVFLCSYEPLNMSVGYLNSFTLKILMKCWPNRPKQQQQNHQVWFFSDQIFARLNTVASVFQLKMPCITWPLLPNARTTMEAETTSRSAVVVVVVMVIMVVCGGCGGDTNCLVVILIVLWWYWLCGGGGELQSL